MQKALKIAIAASALTLVTGAAAATASATTNPTHTKAAATAQVAAPSFAQTVCHEGVVDGQVLYYFNSSITASQPIVASASEGILYGEGMNQANVYSEGVTVLAGEVVVRVHTGWGTPLNVCLHYIG